MTVALGLLSGISSSVLAQRQTLQIRAKECLKLDRQKFSELLSLELGEAEIAARIEVACKKEVVRIDAHSLDGLRNASRIVQAVFSEADPERVLALAASELFEVRWNRVVVKNEPLREAHAKPEKTWNFGPEVGGRIQADLLLLHVSLHLEKELMKGFSLGAIAIGNYGHASRATGNVRALWLGAGVTSSIRLLQLDSLAFLLAARVTAGWAQLAGSTQSTRIHADVLNTWAFDGSAGLILRTNTGAGPFDIGVLGGTLLPEVRGGVADDNDVRLSGVYGVSYVSFRPAF